jgi:hypothetical protein
MGVSRSGSYVDSHATYQSEIPFWLVILLAVALIGVTFWLYRRTAEYLTPGRRYTLAALRAMFLCLLLLLVLKPIVTIDVSGAVRRPLIVAIDNSHSMGIEEHRTEQNDITRVAIAKGDVAKDAGLGAQYKYDKDVHISRLDLVKLALANPKIGMLAKLQEDFDIIPVAFNQTATVIPRTTPAVAKQSNDAQSIASFIIAAGIIATVGGVALMTFLKPRKAGMIVTGSGIFIVIISFFVLDYLDRKNKQDTLGDAAMKNNYPWLAEMAAIQGGQTAIGGSLRETINLNRGQSPVGILLFSDFQNNSGLSPVDAMKNQEIPVYAVGIGIDKPKDVAVTSVMVDPVVFVRDDAQVVVSIRSGGLDQRKGRVVLKEMIPKPGLEKEDEKILDSKEITFDGKDQTFTLKFSTTEERRYTLAAGVEIIDGETTADNNFIRKHVKVNSNKIKVLQIEQTPRWEYHFLQGMLMRDRRVEYKTLLLDADPAVTAIPGSPYIRDVPIKEKDVQQYHLIIIGDVDLNRLPKEFLTSLKDSVDKLGVSVIMMAGRKFSPASYRGTPLETILPVEIDLPRLGVVSTSNNDRPIRLELTELGNASPMLRLSDSEEENNKRWSLLPPIYWTARITRAKVGAEILVVDPDPIKQTKYGKMPVVAMKDYGSGSVLYIGTDNTWRWRKNLSEQDFIRFWGQMIERMAISARGNTLGVTLKTDRQTYTAKDEVKTFARLYYLKDDKYHPYTDEKIEATYEHATDKKVTGKFTLYRVAEQPGVYTGNFPAPDKMGAYIWKTGKADGTVCDFAVTNQTSELAQVALNGPLAQELASSTGGGSYREETMYRIPDDIAKNSQKKITSYPIDFAFTPMYFLIIMTVVSIEWVIRKLCQLK